MYMAIRSIFLCIMTILVAAKVLNLQSSYSTLYVVYISTFVIMYACQHKIKFYSRMLLQKPYLKIIYHENFLVFVYSLRPKILYSLYCAGEKTAKSP